MVDLADALGKLVGQLAKAGAPVLTSMIGTALGGPAGAVVGGLAGTLADKAVGELAKRLGTAPTPEAVAEKIELGHEGAVSAAIQQAEAAAPELMRIWEIEATRVSDAQTAEIERGFGAWQFWRGAWQALIVGGWAILLLACVFGGGRVAPLLPMKDVVEAWGSVTLTWLAVFNGGHTLKQIAPAIGFGRKGAGR